MRSFLTLLLSSQPLYLPESGEVVISPGLKSKSLIGRHGAWGYYVLLPVVSSVKLTLQSKEIWAQRLFSSLLLLRQARVSQSVLLSLHCLPSKWLQDYDSHVWTENSFCLSKQISLWQSL